MRIHELRSWPPSSFKSADRADADCASVDLDELHVASASFIPGRRTGMPGDLVLVLTHRTSGDTCTARLQVDDPELGLKLELVLGQVRGVSLAQAGRIELSSP